MFTWSCVISDPESSLSASEILQLLCDRIFNFKHGNWINSWNVSFKIHVPSPSMDEKLLSTYLFTLSTSDQPGKVYTSINGVMIETESGFDTILSRCKSMWQPPRLQGTVTSGSIFDCDEFLVRIGTLMTNQGSFGVLCQVETTQEAKHVQRFLDTLVPRTLMRKGDSNPKTLRVYPSQVSSDFSGSLQLIHLLGKALEAT